ncbi:MAG: MlaD family protein [Chitinophagales bacterium]
MKFIAIFLVALISFKSCLKDETKIYVVLDDASDLQDGSKVKCKGLSVGRISDIKIIGDKVIATVKLYDDFIPTKGSTAEVNFGFLLAKRSLNIIPSSSNEPMASGDTIYAKKSTALDMIDNILKGVFPDSSYDLNLDSLSEGLLNDSLKIKKIIQNAEKTSK